MSQDAGRSERPSEYSPGENLIEREEDLTRTTIRFEKEFFGLSPRRVSAYFVRDIIVVRSIGILSPAERQLAETKEGALLLRELRLKEFEHLKDLLRYRLEVALQTTISGLSVDVCPEANEITIICRLPEER